MIQQDPENVAALAGLARCYLANGDKERAEAAIRDFNAPRLVHPPWQCPACHEDNEANFGSCWNCSGDRPDLPE